MSHTCHALGCQTPCPPAHLMCRPHWFTVPPEMRAEVNRTVGSRDTAVNHTWAPWWRAQAKAVDFLARRHFPLGEGHDEYLAKAMTFADKLEAKRRQPA